MPQIARLDLSMSDGCEDGLVAKGMLIAAMMNGQTTTAGASPDTTGSWGWPGGLAGGCPARPWLDTQDIQVQLHVGLDGLLFVFRHVAGQAQGPRAEVWRDRHRRT